MVVDYIFESDIKLHVNGITDLSTLCMCAYTGGHTCAWLRWLELKAWSAGFRASVSEGIPFSALL